MLLAFKFLVYELLSDQTLLINVVVVVVVVVVVLTS